MNGHVPLYGVIIMDSLYDLHTREKWPLVVKNITYLTNIDAVLNGKIFRLNDAINKDYGLVSYMLPSDLTDLLKQQDLSSYLWIESAHRIHIPFQTDSRKLFIMTIPDLFRQIQFNFRTRLFNKIKTTATIVDCNEDYYNYSESDLDHHARIMADFLTDFFEKMRLKIIPEFYPIVKYGFNLFFGDPFIHSIFALDLSSMNSRVFFTFEPFNSIPYLAHDHWASVYPCFPKGTYVISTPKNNLIFETDYGYEKKGENGLDFRISIKVYCFQPSLNHYFLMNKHLQRFNNLHVEDMLENKTWPSLEIQTEKKEKFTLLL